MRRKPSPIVLASLALLAGCSINFDRFLQSPGSDAGARTDTGGVTPTDLGTSPTDLGTSPTDTGTPPRDTGTVTATDTGTVTPTDTGTPPRDVGTSPAPCRAPYLLAAAENLDSGAGRLLRWSFADDRRCDDLTLTIQRPRAVGVAYDTIADLGGPQLIVVNEEAVSVVDPSNGAVIRDLPAAGPPRSVFDIVANGAGTFAVAYSFTGDSPPGSVGSVRVFDHRSNNLREVQAWQRNMQFGLSVLSMTAYPGNQGQYLQVRPSDTGSGYSTFVTSPSGSGLHPRTTPALIADRNNVRAVTAYRSADRRAHYAVTLSAGTATPAVYIAASNAGSSSLTDAFTPVVRCSEPCPAITRAVGFPDENDSAAAICELSGTAYSVVRVGGASTGCHMLDTDATPGRWRIHDLAVMPR